MADWRRDLVRHQDEKRPDPEEPYRYLCPECDNHRVVKRHTEHQIKDLDNTHRRKGTVQGWYYCNACKTRLYQVYDRKNDERTRP